MEGNPCDAAAVAPPARRLLMKGGCAQRQTRDKAWDTFSAERYIWHASSFPLHDPGLFHFLGRKRYTVVGQA